MDKTGCNVCTKDMIAANVGVDGGWPAGLGWIFDPGLIPDQAAAAPHYMVANDLLGNVMGNSGRRAAADRSKDLIAQLLGEAHAHARKGDCANGAIALGKALHTIQDKYSHTNEKGLPISNKEHKGLGTRIDDPVKNSTRYTGAQHESNATVQEYVDILTKEGCYPCN